MFGVIVAGRLVQDITAVSENKFLAEIANADDVNHIVVFMTGAVAFPEGMGASVHFCWPETGWSLLGFLTNDKPSVIFKITGLKAGVTAGSAFASHSTHIAQIGISVEALGDLQQQTPVVSTAASKASGYAEFAQQMIENFVNYASSFAISQSQMTQQPNVSFIPFQIVEQWYVNTKRKMEVNPNWWKK